MTSGDKGTRRKRRREGEVDEDAKMAMVHLRYRQDLNQAAFAQKTGISSTQISLFDQGKATVPRKALERMAEATGVPRSYLVLLLRMLRSGRLALEGWSRTGRAPADAALLDGLALSAEVAETILAVRGPRPGMPRLSAAEEREQAAERWEKMKRRTPRQRLALVEEAEEFRGWAMVERLAAASREAATASAATTTSAAATASATAALELARLAHLIAELGRPGEERQRSRNLGYAELHVANALRLAGDLPGADRALAAAVQLWEAGAPGDPGDLDGAVFRELAEELRRA